MRTTSSFDRASRRALLSALPCLLLFSSVTALAQERPPLGVSFSYSFFDGAGSTTLMQFTYQFVDRMLSFQPKEGERQGRIYMQLRLRPVGAPESLPPMVFDWVNVVPEPEAGMPDRLIAGQRPLAAPPGSFTAELYFEDVFAPERRDSVRFTVDIPAFAPGTLSLSDVVIASELYPSDDAENPFHHNGQIVVPNIEGVITPPLLLLSSYVELYNAASGPGEQVRVAWQLADANRRIFFERADTLPRPTGAGIVLTDEMPVDSIPSGDYYLVVRAWSGLSGAGVDSVMSARKFRLENPEIDRLVASRSSAIPATSASDGMVDPLFAGLNDAELDREFQKARPLALPQERDIWDQLEGAEAKARMLSNFWRGRDDRPETPANEARDIFYERIARAGDLFAAMGREGWDTDRGRILVQYGEPDGTDRHPHDFNMRPYEIWTYSSLGYQFVFVERSEGTGLYSLVHSNAPREVRHENWLVDFAMLNKKWRNE